VRIAGTGVGQPSQAASGETETASRHGDDVDLRLDVDQQQAVSDERFDLPPAAVERANFTAAMN
jgi:hypothetical protein